MTELRDRVAELEGPRRNEMAARIKAARELGDLKENADYHIAKDDQAHLEAEIRRLRARLQSAEVVAVDDSADQAFAFGRTAEVSEGGSGKTHQWTLVGSTEADIATGKISAESPVGEALRDTAVGASVEVETPGGAKTYTVERLI
jgi:transcription elongation factor GreA